MGLLLIVDGVSALIAPRTYLRELKRAIPVMDDLLEYFAEHPEMTRGVSLSEIILGAWLLVR
jgi:hypothetical protein